jgi:hypothetical protein
MSVLDVLLLTMFAIGVCGVGTWRAFRFFGLDILQTLVWLGLAEVPETRRRQDGQRLRLVA